MGGGGDGGRNGGGEELIETVLTCEGSISDPQLPAKILLLIHHLQIITHCESNDWQVRKVEPWNSVRVTFSIPKEAANRLHQLAQAGDTALRQLGILSVQVEGDQIVSLKVAGPNNETAEIVLRSESATPSVALGIAGPSSAEGVVNPTVARSVTQALNNAGMLPGFSQTQHHQPHPVPQFRSPTISSGVDAGGGGVPVVVGRTPMVQSRPLQGQQPPPTLQSYTYAGAGSGASTTMHACHTQQTAQTQQNPHPSSAGTTFPHPPHSSTVVARPVFPTNPPPPYPTLELRTSAPPPSQIGSGSQTQHQYVVSPVRSVITPPPPQTVLQHGAQPIGTLNSLSQPMAGGYRVAGTQVSVASTSATSSVGPGRGQVRTQVSMVKNSPLLVGLLQQPEHSSSVMSRTAKGGSVNLAPQGASVPPSALATSPPSTSLENGPLSGVISAPAGAVNSGTYIGRSRDGFTTHQQIFSGGSVITNSVPPPPPNRHTPGPVLGHVPSPSSPVPRLTNSDDPRRSCLVGSASGLVGGPSGVGKSTTSNHLSSSTLGSTSASSGVKDETKGGGPSKKENQYLINPNTGLLELRPNTDSSDSEAEERIESPLCEEPRANSLVSDDESNLSAASHKETDHSDSELSRVSAASLDSRKMVNCERGKSQDRDSSPGSSWENNNMISSSPGEIRLRLKLGKEQVAQATIVGNGNKKADRRGGEFPLNAGISSSNSVEPRVPKLHIKLHSSQPVIVKTVEETETCNRKSLKELASSSSREDKNKRKSGRSKPRNELDLDSVKSKNLKLKMIKDKACEEDVTSQLLKILESKRNKQESEFDEGALVRYKDTAESRIKGPRMLEVTKPSKVESKLRTRLKKTPLRKVGDLNSLGEIASHKIMETLPPSITKVAAMHTQQPHRNPNASSPIPFSSITTSMFSGSSISASPVTTSACLSLSTSSPASSCLPAPMVAGAVSQVAAGDLQLKAELEKRGSEIIQKTDMKVDVEKNGGDVVMTKVCMNSPAIKNLMNGDVTHSEKMTINQMRFKRAGSIASPSDFPSTTKLTIKRKNTEETHSLKALKKEGLGSVPTLLNSSVLINKVSPDKTSVSSLSHRQSEDLSEKLLKKVESIKGPLRSEIAGLKSNSDITIHSVSKGDILGLSKGSDFDRRTDLTIKTKPEVTKVGRVTCVDVMDRKALEEALKSSRNSSKKNDMFKSTSCMVARLSRWNSIDSSNPVPLSSHSHQQASDSTNLISGSVKAEPKESGDCESEKSVMLSTVIEKVKTESDVSLQSNTIINVNNEKDCDNSGKDNFSSPNLKSENKIVRQEAVLESSMPEAKPEEGENEETKTPVHLQRDVANVECNSKATSTSLVTTTTTTASVIHPSANSSPHDAKLVNTFETSRDAEAASKVIREQGKLVDSAGSISLVVKSEAESPEGTPKGDHGNGQGGEDSGIESMDALSEKSPNHSDQSPNRRDEKECEMFPDKCKVKAVGKCSRLDEKKISASEVPRNTTAPSSGKVNCNEGLRKVEIGSKEQVPFAEQKATNIDPISQLGGPVEPLLSQTELSSGNSLNSETGQRNRSNQEASAMGTQTIPAGDSKIREKSECDSESSSGKSLFSEGDQPFSGNVIYATTETLPSTSPPDESTARSMLRKSTVVTSESLSGSCPQLSVSRGCDVARATLCTDSSVPKCPIIDPTSAEESLSSSQNKLSDSRPVAESSLNTPLRKASETESCTTVDLPPSPVACSVSLSITTTSLSVASPKASVITSSALLHPSVSVPSIPSMNSTLSQCPTKDISQANMLLSTSKESVVINSGFKPSLLAITLSRPPGASIMTSQYATSIANSMETMTTTGSAPVLCNITTTTTTPATSAVNKIVSSVESPSSTNNVVYCHSLSCNNNSIAYCNSYTTTTSTTATMIILAASTNTTSTMITTPPTSTKTVTLKPSLNQSTPSPINPPVGKTFRLVALPGINSMTPASSPVKGQLVTLKPVVSSGVATTIAKNSHLLQTVPALKSEDPGNSSILKPQVTPSLIPPVDSPLPSATLEPVSSEGHLEDLDFVGFSSISETEPKKPPEPGCGYKHSPPITPLEKPTLKPPNILSPTEEEPTPLRVRPPLYTYGNRERKKDVELEGEDRERDPQTNLPESIKPDSSLEITTENESEVKDDESRVKTKEKKLHALTIEIPNTENFPDEKRLTRSTRQSARLASPKVNSPASSELSPRSDKRSPANAQTMGKPSPVGILRTSVSPALRLTKRRRHESESSTASNVSEDQVEPPSKTARRKASEKMPQHDTKDESLRAKGVKREMDHEKDRVEGESSDEESLVDEDGMKRRNLSTASSSTNEDEDDSSRPSSRTGRPPAKSTPRARDRTVVGEAACVVRDTTPTRRTPRQNRGSTPSGPPAAANSPAATDKPIESKDLVKEVKEKPPLDLPKGPEEVPKECPPKEGEKKMVDKKGVAQECAKEAMKILPKPKKESELESDSKNGRRKTRSSTTNVGTVSEEVNKRRRICKDK